MIFFQRYTSQRYGVGMSVVLCMSFLLICSPTGAQAAVCSPSPMQSSVRFSSKKAPPLPVKKSAKKVRKSKTKPLNIPTPNRADALLPADTSRKDHRVEVFADAGSDRAAVRVTLNESQPIEIVAFNILGKRVAEVYSGEARAGMNTVSFDLSGLSDGVYICVVRGRNFKTAEKFLVSR